MNVTMSCESCGMTMAGPEDHAPGHPDSRYCRFCSTETGELQQFDERLERLTQWSVRQDGLDPEASRTKSLEYMRRMPLWRDHPRLKESIS